MNEEGIELQEFPPQQTRKDLEASLPGLLSVSKEDTDYYVAKHMDARYYDEHSLTEHEKKSGIAASRELALSIMPHVYDAIDQVRAAPLDDLRKEKLHHSRGKKLVANKQDVLEFDIAGSSFKEFRREHRGFHGKGKVRVDGVMTDPDKKLANVSWYNRARWLNWIHGTWHGALYGIRTEKQIALDNAHVLSAHALRERELGASQTVDGVFHEHIRSKVSGHKTRITMAGPLAINGMSNSGEYSMENLRGYMLTMGKDYLTGIFSGWNSPADGHDVTLIIRGHSRGAVAASEGAMMINQWLHEHYSQYEKFVKFELIQYDPVPGNASREGVNKLYDHRYPGTFQQGADVMRPLGAQAETTVFCSIHIDNDPAHKLMFDPQEVLGAKRVIIAPMRHGVGLNEIDDSQVRQGGGPRQSELHRPTYTDAATGDAYRSSGLNELAEGVYYVDAQNTLIRFQTYADAQTLLSHAVPKDVNTERYKTVLSMAKSWFDAHPAPGAGNPGAPNNPGAGNG